MPPPLRALFPRLDIQAGEEPHADSASGDAVGRRSRLWLAVSTTCVPTVTIQSPPLVDRLFRARRRTLDEALSGRWRRGPRRPHAGGARRSELTRTELTRTQRPPSSGYAKPVVPYAEGFDPEDYYKLADHIKGVR